MISDHCSRLLAETSNLHPSYGDRLANHLPMALIALDRMSATPAQLERFAARYSRKLVQRGRNMPARSPITSLGVREDFEGVRAYFANSISESGADAVLRTWIPVLMPGVAASAFHGLIRLAYGIDAFEESEIATALAYWTVEYQKLEVTPGVTDRTLTDIAASAYDTVRDHKFAPGIIVDRIVEIATLPSLRYATVQPATLDYRQISDFAIGVYSARENFTFLHLVTACHAFKTILPYLEDEAGATRYLWQAVLIAYLSTGVSCKPMLTVPPDSHRSWERCLETAVESADDHAIKLTYTAWKESSLDDDPRYLYSAWRKLFESDKRS